MAFSSLREHKLENAKFKKNILDEEEEDKITVKILNFSERQT